MIISVISDTHGLLRPEAIDALHGSELIIHAGDVGSPDILDRLAKVAPVKAIRGNVDIQSWAARLPDTRIVEIEGKRLFVIHDVNRLRLDTKAERVDAVISGHSHKPVVEWRGDVMFLNPGSAGPRRFRLPVSIARIRIVKERLEAEVVELPVTAE